ncbi:MAG: helix-hairpin-helix domain-containing protein, partial [bacterium]
VELEGTTVKRASVHNVSIVRSLKLGIGDRIRVYKANMIIPQISENLTMSDSLEIPSLCPVCGGRTQIRREVDTEVLICTNPDCTAKKIKSFAHFVSRNAMNIEGLSEMTLEKFIGRGFIHNFADIYHLETFRSQIEEMEGFGRRSYENLAASIMRSRKTTLSRVLYAVGIVGIGTANARLICDHYQNDLQAILAASAEELGEIEGIGPVLAASVSDFLKDESNREKLDALLSELEIEAPAKSEMPQIFAGKTFVITGKVYHFENRDALKDYILKLGGKAAGSVSAKTDYLINNDVTSTSGKNKKAKQLGVPIISEDEFLAMAEAEGAV